jgi:hypothetical protein
MKTLWHKGEPHTYVRVRQYEFELTLSEVQKLHAELSKALEDYDAEHA